MLVEDNIARATADPVLVTEAAMPGGWQDLTYYPLHGSPEMYYSAYSPAFLQKPQLYSVIQPPMIGIFSTIPLAELPSQTRFP